MSGLGRPVQERTRQPLGRSATVNPDHRQAIWAAPPELRIQLAGPLVDDPVLVVRVKAARALAVAPKGGMNESLQRRLDQAFAEYVASSALMRTARRHT